MALIRRGKILYFVKRVPKEYARFDGRKIVQISLKADSEAEARQKAQEVERALNAYWVALATKRGDPQKFQAMVTLAASRRVRYMPIKELYAQEGLGEMLERIEGLDEEDSERSEVVNAVLGSETRPPLLLSQLTDMYFDIAAEQTKGKSPDQIRRWKNPRIKAFRNLISVIGDKDISKLRRDDALDFRAWWQTNLRVKNLSENSANKDLAYISSTLNAIKDYKRLPLDNVFAGLSFKEVKKQRPPFSVDWIIENLTPGKLAGLNDQARAIVLVMINTGCRPSEICGVLPCDVHLSGNIPYLHIRHNEARRLKNDSSERKMPLLGVSLEAMRGFPEGFPRYRGKDRFSNLANKYLRNHGLLESDAHSVYSLRHSFEDRLLQLNVPDRIAATLMGHATIREKYGSGPSLDHLAEVLSRLAL